MWGGVWIQVQLGTPTVKAGRGVTTMVLTRPCTLTLWHVIQVQRALRIMAFQLLCCRSPTRRSQALRQLPLAMRVIKLGAPHQHPARAVACH